MLGKLSNEEQLLDLYKTATNDPSYSVAAQALYTLYDKSPELAFEEAKRFEADSNAVFLSALLTIFSSSGADEENRFFLEKEQYFNDFGRYSFIQLYGKFLLGRSDSVIQTGVPILEKTAQQSKIWWVRLAALQAIDSLLNMYADREKELRSLLRTGKDANGSDASTGERSADNAHAQYDKLKNIFETLKSNEKDKNVLRFFK